MKELRKITKDFIDDAGLRVRILTWGLRQCAHHSTATFKVKVWKIKSRETLSAKQTRSMRSAVHVLWTLRESPIIVQGTSALEHRRSLIVSLPGKNRFLPAGYLVLITYLLWVRTQVGFPLCSTRNAAAPGSVRNSCSRLNQKRNWRNHSSLISSCLTIEGFLTVVVSLIHNYFGDCALPGVHSI